ncbi:MAG: hypothetical protein K6C05_03750 [Anaerovibrio sp.]|nr:hypothetical protein [Anaerovibrio sp.]
MAMEKESGRKDLEAVAKAANISSEEHWRLLLKKREHWQFHWNALPRLRAPQSFWKVHHIKQRHKVSPE